MKKIHQLVLGLILLGGLSACENSAKNHAAESGNPSFSSKVDAYLESHELNNRLSGNVLIAKGDSILYSRSFGLANRSFGIENATSTKFLIGSITKPFTAYAILLLENQGKLSLDDKLSTFFPEFPNAEKVTIKHLLTHRSGIKDYHAFSNWKEDGKLSVTPQSTMRTVAEDPFIFEPGERYSYTNSGYILLGLIIEQRSGQSFGEFMQNEVLNPLDLKNSGVMANGKIVADLAEGYSTNPREVKKAEYINYNQPYASGNMYSTPEDLWKFTMAVMSSKLLPAEKTEEIFQVSERYGYGWGIRNYDGVAAYGHHGAMNGFVGSMTYVPEGEYFVCFLTNDDNTPEYTLAEDLVAIIGGKVVVQPTEEKLIELSSAMKMSAIGDYLIKPGDTLKVFEAEGKLYLQETGQVKHELFPVGGDEYAFQLFEFRAVFSEPKEGKSQTLSFVGKANLSAKRIAVSGNRDISNK